MQNEERHTLEARTLSSLETLDLACTSLSLHAPSCSTNYSH